MATLVQAVRMALHYGETHLGVTDVFGEDVGPPLGGVFTATQGLRTAWNSPLDERGILGTAMGIAYAGGRPVCEIQFCDYAFNSIDLLKVAGNQRWASAGVTKASGASRLRTAVRNAAMWSAPISARASVTLRSAPRRLGITTQRSSVTKTVSFSP